MAEEVNVQSAIKKGQVIARFCHPSALQIIQQWIARLKKRWDEVSVHVIALKAVLFKAAFHVACHVKATNKDALHR